MALASLHLLTGVEPDMAAGLGAGLD